MATPTTSQMEACMLQAMVMRRYCYRKQFQRLRSDPCAHSKESGYVFDSAMQRFLSMKVTQLDYFQTTLRNRLFGICAIVIPMSVYGYLIYTSRSEIERKIRCGELKYKDRLFKFQ